MNNAWLWTQSKISCDERPKQLKNPPHVKGAAQVHNQVVRDEQVRSRIAQHRSRYGRAMFLELGGLLLHQFQAPTSPFMIGSNSVKRSEFLGEDVKALGQLGDAISQIASMKIQDFRKNPRRLPLNGDTFRFGAPIAHGAHLAPEILGLFTRNCTDGLATHQ